MDYLDKFEHWLAEHRRALWLLFALATLNLVCFALWFGFHPNNDTDSYLISMEYFRGQTDEVYPNRYLNPFYSIVGATVLRWLSPPMVLIVLNIIFYYGLVGLTYGLIRRVFQNASIGLITATTIMTGYPLLRYGLTQVQDMGGYFWFILTLYAGWRWFENHQTRWLLIGSLAISGGLLTKESGAMGALFFAALITLSQLSWRAKFTRVLIVASIAAVTLGINMWRGHLVNYSSAQWFIDNWIVYGPGNYSAFKWAAVNVTTYNLVWPFAVIGAYVLWFKKQWLTAQVKYYFLAVLIPSLSYFAWPIFIGRTVFISAWLVVPLAAVAVAYLLKQRWWLGVMVWAALLVVPYVLQETLRYVHFFQIFDICHYQVRCSWNYFWDNRHSFSETL